jgi:hypothetical protein
MAPTITLGNPIVITSGYMNTSTVDYRGEWFVNKMIWDVNTGDIVPTSSLFITKNVSGPAYFNLTPVSGRTPFNDDIDMVVKDPVVKCMPTGTLHIYTK